MNKKSLDDSSLDNICVPCNISSSQICGLGSVGGDALALIFVCRTSKFLIVAGYYYGEVEIYFLNVIMSFLDILL